MRGPVEHELLQQAGALRALARDLVGEQDADDLVQDAAVEALRAPPRRPGPLGGWLASIVQHLASKHRRAARRRLQRELCAARPEGVPPDRHGDDRDTFRRLTAAVLGLPEPYQSTVLQRYLRELSPAAIAAATGTPVRTVKTRLQRALALLRQELDRDGSDWRAALGTLFGLERLQPAAAAAVAAGVLVMGTGAKLLAAGAGAAVALVAVLWWPGGGPPAMAPGGNAAGGAGGVATAAAVASSRDGPAVGVGEVPAGAPSGRAVAAAPKDVVIRGRCVDENGRPLSGVTASLHGWLRTRGELSSETWRDPTDVTGDDGRYALAFAAPADVLRYELTLHREHRCDRSGSPSGIAAGREIDLGDAVLFPLATVQGRVVDRRGQPQQGVRVEVHAELSDAENDLVLRTSSGPSQCDSAVDGTFAIDLPVRKRGWAKTDRRLVGGQDDVRFALDGPSPIQLELVVFGDDELPPIRGIVVDEAGMPVAGAAVALEWSTTQETKADGAFLLRPGPSNPGNGPFLVRVRAPGFEDVDSGPHPLGTADLRIVLRRVPGLVVRARAADTGEPVSAFAVDVVRGFRQIDTGARTHYRRQQWPAGMARLDVPRHGDHFVCVDPGPGLYAPSAFVPVTIGDAGGVVVVELPRRHERVLRLRDADGAPVRASVELIDPVGQPLWLNTEAFAMDDWERIMGIRKLPLLQLGDTDERGELQLSGPTGRDLALRLSGAGIARQIAAPVRLDSEDPLMVTVQRGAVWTGRLLPADVGAALFAVSQPAAGERADEKAHGIELWREAADAYFGEKLNRYVEPPFTWDAAGRFRIVGVPAGTWQVTLLSDNLRYHCDEITVEEGGTLEHDLDVAALRQCPVELQVFVDGVPLADGRVNMLGRHALDHGGMPLRSSRLRQLDAEGRASFLTFAGQYFVHVYPGSPEILFSPSLTVVAGGRAQQTLNVQRAHLALRLLTPQGGPAAGVPLQLGGSWNFPATTDADGRMATDGVAAGRYEVRVRPRSLCDEAARSAYASVHGWGALGPAWLDAGTIDVLPGAGPEIVLRLPSIWDR